MTAGETADADASRIAQVVTPEEAVSFERGGGIVTRLYFGPWNAPDAEVATAVSEFPSGAALAEHTHNVEESVLVLAGSAVVVVAGVAQTLGVGEAIRLPRGTAHVLRNEGESRLVVYSVFGGPSVTRTVLSTGETLPHFPIAY